MGRLISAAVSVFLVMYLWLWPVRGRRCSTPGCRNWYLVLFSYRSSWRTRDHRVRVNNVLMLLTRAGCWGERCRNWNAARDGWVSVADMAATTDSAGDSGDNAMPGFSARRTARNRGRRYSHMPPRAAAHTAVGHPRCYERQRRVRRGGRHTTTATTTTAATASPAAGPP